MPINLLKEQTIDLRNNDKGEVFDLSTVTVGLGWDVKQKPEGGFLSKLFGGSREEDFDLNAIAFLLDANDKLVNRGRDLQFSNDNKIGLHGGDVIFFDYKTFPGMDTSQYVFGTPNRALLQKVQQLINNGEFIIHTGDYNLTDDD
jgi:tellurium resistance protein TerD